MARYTAMEPQIGFAFDSQSGIHALASDRVIPFLTYPNGVAFVPRGCDVYSNSDHGGEYLSVLGVGSEGSNEPFSDRMDRQATTLAHNIRRQLLNLTPSDSLYLEELLRGVG
jgi:AraC family transcriptional regulator